VLFDGLAISVAILSAIGLAISVAISVAIPFAISGVILLPTILYHIWVENGRKKVPRRGGVKKGGFRGVKNPLFWGSKRGFLGGRKGGFLRRGGGAGEFTRVILLGYARNAAGLRGNRGAVMGWLD
jgi:hypothetical protein